MRVLMKKFKKSFDMAEPKPMTVELEVGNTDRAFGTIFGSEITRKFGNTLPEDTFHVICNGRPELWCLYPRWPDLGTGWRFQRLYGQGPFRRQADRLPAQGCHL